MHTVVIPALGSLEEEDLNSRSAQSICRAVCSVNWAPLESPLWLVFKYFGYTLLQNPALCNNTYKHLFGFLKLGCYTCPACVCPHSLSIASTFTDFSQAVQRHQAVYTWASTSTVLTKHQQKRENILSRSWFLEATSNKVIRLQPTLKTSLCG